MNRRSTSLALAATLAAALTGFAASATAGDMDKGMDDSMNTMPAHSNSMKSKDSGMMKTGCKPQKDTGMSNGMGQSDKMAKACDDAMMKDDGMMKHDDKSMPDESMKKPQ